MHTHLKNVVRLCLSLRIYPAADVPETVGRKRKNGKLVIINLQKTPLDDLAEFCIHADTQTVFQRLMEELEKKKKDKQEEEKREEEEPTFNLRGGRKAKRQRT
eukprot:TRINITY_DN32672_c0_g1_i1.p2 TRINITY_DN32672_c0_g1~~TRINITY_DN32672_c0_g1_i1.p2  ORF type:complete len:103 (+),score=21.01 TRINITY_DN32672_c0_g1_i1:815-1123(+)